MNLRRGRGALKTSVSVLSIALITFGPIATAHAESEIEALMGSDGAAVSDQELGRMRGGFIDAKGLLIRFAVKKTTKVNGDITRETSLVVDNAKKAIQTTTTAVTTPAVAAPVTTPASAASSAAKASTSAATTPVSQTLPTTTSVATGLPAAVITASVPTPAPAAAPSISGAVIAVDGLSNNGASAPPVTTVAPVVNIAAAAPTDTPGLVSMTAGVAPDLVHTADLPAIAPPTMEIASVPQTGNVDPVPLAGLIPDVPLDLPATTPAIMFAAVPEIMIASPDVAAAPVADVSPTVLPATIESHLVPDAAPDQTVATIPQVPAAILPTTPQSSTPEEPSTSASSEVEQPLVPITTIAIATTPDSQIPEVVVADATQNVVDDATTLVLAPTTELQTIEEEIPLDAALLRRMLFTPSVIVNEQSDAVIQEFTEVTVDIGNFSVVSSDALRERLASSIADQINTQVTFSLMHN